MEPTAMTAQRALLLAIVACAATSIVRAQEPLSPGASRADAELGAEDWAGIRRAHERQRHAVHPTPGGWQAHNPGQRWSTLFDGRGFSVHPDAGGWSWGLELVSWGFAGSERPVSTPVCAAADGQRVGYEWDELLEEWYVNDARGLEHGYTVRERPSGTVRAESRALTFRLAIRGELMADLQADGRGVRFLAGDGAAVLTYSGLTVRDAGGRLLPAAIELAPDVDSGLLVVIDERDARYPLTIDPTAQQAYLKASNTNALDVFGRSVAMSGDTVVVGSREWSNATGVNGDQSNNSASQSGAAYVFVRSGTSWGQQAYLKASNTGSSDEFGYSVAISGDTIVVGAPYEDSAATGVDGDQGDNSSPAAGAAYVFVRNGTSWSQQAYLKASNTGVDDEFGTSVAISGDTAVIGAPLEASGAAGVDADQSDDSSPGAGAAYVFVRQGASWSQQAYLKASNPDGEPTISAILNGDRFGESVGVSGNTVVVGAHAEDSSATGVDGDQGNADAFNNFNSGAAYVFVRGGTTWSQQAYLKASNTGQGDAFGRSVALSGDTIVVGASTEDSSATGVNGDQDDNGATFSGAAYVFVRQGTTWSQQAYLKASNTSAADLFGAVAISGDTLVVGAPNEDSGATGVDGDQTDDSALQAGAAYVFVRHGSGWTQTAYLKASNTDPGDLFGGSVAVAGATVLVGAIREDSAATGVNGAQGGGAQDSGAAYSFELAPLASCAFRNGSGVNPPDYACATDPVLGTTFQASISLVPTVGASTLTTLVAFGMGGPTSGTFAPGGELLVLSPFRIAMSPSGSFSFPLPADPMLEGLEVFSQGLRIESGGARVLLNALDLVLGI